MEQLFAAMAAAFPEIEGATKEKNNPAFRSKYADLGSVVDAIKPALVKHGLWFAQKTHDSADGVTVETIVCHKGGDQMSFGNLFVPASKRDAQGFGSALTYARRYSLMTAFGVAPEDDDGNAAAKAASAGGNGASNGEQVNAHPEPPAKRPPWPDGPTTGITQAKAVAREMWRDVAAASDEDSLDIVCNDKRDFMNQMEEAERANHPGIEFWKGDGLDNPGLSNFIKKCRAELKREKRAYEADLTRAG